MAKANAIETVSVSAYNKGGGVRYLGQCIHAWHHMVKDTASSAEEICLHCGAVCSRDSKGRIVEFDAKIPPPAPTEFRRKSKPKAAPTVRQ